MKTVLTRDQKAAMLTALDTGSAGPLHTGKVKLIKADIAVSETTLVADLDAIEANFDGYAAKTVVLGPVFEDGGVLKREAASLQFQPTGSVVTNQIYGEYYTDSAGTTLVGVKKYDAPIPLTGIWDALIVEVTISYGD